MSFQEELLEAMAVFDKTGSGFLDKEILVSDSTFYFMSDNIFYLRQDRFNTDAQNVLLIKWPSFLIHLNLILILGGRDSKHG